MGSRQIQDFVRSFFNSFHERFHFTGRLSPLAIAVPAEVIAQFGDSGADGCPPQKQAASTKPMTGELALFCSGLFVPCFSGRKGHLYGQTDHPCK
jgi:hypothetical protein